MTAVETEATEALGEDRRSLRAEVLVVLAVAVVPYLMAAFLLAVDGTSGRSSSLAEDVLGVLGKSIGNIALVAYLIRRSGLPVARFGLQSLEPRSDGPIALMLVVVPWFLTIAILSAFPPRAADPWSTFVASPSPLNYALILVGSCFNGLSEELVMRAYLITRLEQLLGSTARAVAASTALFAAYHLYAGFAGLTFGVVFGLVAALLFVRFRRLIPLVAAHIFMDILGFVTRLT